MLSMLTVPTSGWRRPRISTSQLFVSAAPPAVAVADRHASRPRSARARRPAAPVAGRVARLEAPHGGDPGAQRQRRLEPVRRGVRRRTGPSRRCATPQRTMSKWLAGSRSAAALLAAWHDQVVAPAAASTNSREGARAGRRRGRRRARRRWRSGSSARPTFGRAAPAAAPAPRSLVPSRPMPVSSFTCTRRRRAASRDRRSVQATTSASALDAPSRSSAAVSAPITSIGASMPAGAAARRPRRRPRPPASGAARERRLGAPTRRARSASALTTAQSGFGSRRRRAVAFDAPGSTRDAALAAARELAAAPSRRSEPTLAQRSGRRAARRSRRRRSRGRRRSRLGGRAAGAARGRARRAQAASNGVEPLREQRADQAGAGRRRCPRWRAPGVPPGLTASLAAGRATIVSSPLSSTTAPLRSAASRTDASRCAAISLGRRARAGGRARPRGA